MLKGAIISQARTTSTRLPRKVFLEAAGDTVLGHHVSRLAKSGLPVIIATTTNATDDSIVEWAKLRKVGYYRGDEFDVLRRFRECADQFGLDFVVRVTSDCPLVDGELIAAGVKKYLAANDKRLYYSNVLQRTFPRGLDFEVFSTEMLREADERATAEPEREHVTPYIHQNKTGSVNFTHHRDDSDNSDLRWTVDTMDDWELIKTLLNEYNAKDLAYKEILGIVRKNSRLTEINSHIKQKAH